MVRMRMRDQNVIRPGNMLVAFRRIRLEDRIAFVVKISRSNTTGFELSEIGIDQENSVSIVNLISGVAEISQPDCLTFATRCVSRTVEADQTNNTKKRPE